jgi:hypothetical protein
LQVVVNKSIGNSFEDVKKAIAGASFMVKGELIRSPAKGQDFELQVRDADLHSATVCGHSDGTYPIQGRPGLEVSKQPFEKEKDNSADLFLFFLLMTLNLNHLVLLIVSP